jgi:hypothetical protein
MKGKNNLKFGGFLNKSCIKSTISWSVTLCSLVIYRRFGGNFGKILSDYTASQAIR